MFWGKEIGQDTILSQKVGRVGMQLKFYTNLDMLHMSANSSLAQIWTCSTGGPAQVLLKFVHASNFYQLELEIFSFTNDSIFEFTKQSLSNMLHMASNSSFRIMVLNDTFNNFQSRALYS